MNEPEKEPGSQLPGSFISPTRIHPKLSTNRELGAKLITSTRAAQGQTLCSHASNIFLEATFP